MKEKTYEMQLKNYAVEKVSFELNKEFDIQGDPENIQLLPQFTREIIIVDDDNVIVQLSCEINAADGPFFISATVMALFGLEKWNDDDVSRTMINQNTISILYPYLRALISNLTASSSVSPYVLPIMNITNLFPDIDFTKLKSNK